MIEVTSFEETMGAGQNGTDGGVCACGCACSCSCTDACSTNNSASAAASLCSSTYAPAKAAA